MNFYTEKQVLRMMELARFSYASEDKILLSFTPFVLPTDEEIENNAKDYSNIIGNKNGTAIFDYIKGAKWVRDKIQGGEK